MDALVGLAVAPDRFSGRAYADERRLRTLLQECMISAGLGEKDPARPLADIIEPGSSVLLKPNWVLDTNYSGATMDCMVTHPSFIIAVVAEAAAAMPGRILVADAPIQSAQFDRLTPEAWRARASLAAGGIPLEIIDFRNVVTTCEKGRLLVREEVRERSRYVEFDLGHDSLLEPISTPVGRFRNTSYDPDGMTRVQHPGTHRFLLCREPFEVDVVINLPKLKAHSKAGVTAALKNIVGINGDKSYLPHHRVGGSGLGGDCYEGIKPFKRIAEWMLDGANRRIGRSGYLALSRAARLLSRIHGSNIEGKWSGNDTTWRMVLDLNRILLYGDASGKLSESPRRRVFSLTDGIVAGDRNGPLAPEAVNLGVVTFASNSAHADAVHLALMHFDAERVPLVREAFASMRYRLADDSISKTTIRCGNRILHLDEVANSFGVDFRPPDGWQGRIELKALRKRSAGPA